MNLFFRQMTWKRGPHATERSYVNPAVIVYGMVSVLAGTGMATAQAGAQALDHRTFDQLLRTHVDTEGRVNYSALQGEAGLLDSYIQSLATVDLNAMSKPEQLATMINAYNAFTLRLILDHYPIQSIMNIPEGKRWKHERWRFAGKMWSLDALEHQGIRKQFKEPRIHFALVCAAVGCPKLRHEAYAGDRLEEQLEDQSRYVHTHDTWFRYKAGAQTVYLTKLYEWYGSDFDHLGGPIAFASRYSKALAETLKKGNPKIAWLDYDWALNDKRE
ncbi:MAG: DUF547 domain-containing protein [Phycisphaerae bacterium]